MRISRTGGWRLSATFLSVVLALLVSAGCSHADKDDKAPAAGSDKTEAAPKPGVTLEVEAQERLGLKMESPVSARWQPDLHATGWVADPLTFLSAVADYETARTAAAASQSELARTQKLAGQENTSARSLEAAQTAAMRDRLALEAARAKFAGEWGADLAGRTNLMALADDLQNGTRSLVKLFPPVGVFPNPPPATAVVNGWDDDTNGTPADFADVLNIKSATQVQTLLYVVKRKLPPDLAAAVLRYEGWGWVYVQTGTNQFVRAAIPLDRPLGSGWFVGDQLVGTNPIVVIGAQSVLSAELSRGGFTTGERD
jgi:hypothetical protein